MHDHCPDFVKQYLRHYHPLLQEDCPFMRGLDDMIKAHSGGGGSKGSISRKQPRAGMAETLLDNDHYNYNDDDS
eukprot:11064438-Ditylum_brightwellii.AAC.1